MKALMNRIWRSEYFIVLLLIGISSIIAVLTVSDYGISTDEPLSWRFANQTLNSYLGGQDQIIHVDYSHGGGFLIPAKVASLLVNYLFADWLEPYSWHFVYFLFFQTSVFFMFLLARKFVGVWGANFTALLYGTQPLLWGHAFMNPKDLPFLTLFLGAIILGINLTDNLYRIDRDRQPSNGNFGMGLKAVAGDLFFAAIMLGMCWSARTFGSIAFGIIAVYWFIRHRLQHLPYLGLYFAIAIIIGFALWPDLWGSPIQTYLSYIKNVFGFEAWDREILFEGELYYKDNYPRHLVPKLILFQLTESTLIFSSVGLIFVALKTWKKEIDWVLSGLLVGWFFGPVALAIIFHPVVYNGFRHFLFCLPYSFLLELDLSS